MVKAPNCVAKMPARLYISRTEIIADCPIRSSTRLTTWKRADTRGLDPPTGLPSRDERRQFGLETGEDHRRRKDVLTIHHGCEGTRHERNESTTANVVEDTKTNFTVKFARTAASIYPHVR